ncbi:MAG: cell envelope biogenesis protein OmpA, partial [Bacteroidetes bacterium]
MKNLSRLMFALLLVIGFSNANAQDDNNPWQFSFGINAVDLYPVGEDAPRGAYFDEYFNVNDHWNILPSLSTFTLSKYLGENFSFGVGGSVNKISKFGDAGASNLPYFAVN